MERSIWTCRSWARAFWSLEWLGVLNQNRARRQRPSALTKNRRSCPTPMWWPGLLLTSSAHCSPSLHERSSSQSDSAASIGKRDFGSQTHSCSSPILQNWFMAAASGYQHHLHFYSTFHSKSRATTFCKSSIPSLYLLHTASVSYLWSSGTSPSCL